MANSADRDQLASEEANWYGSTLFAKAEYIRVKQDKGYVSTYAVYVRQVLAAHQVIWTDFISCLFHRATII